MIHLESTGKGYILSISSYALSGRQIGQLKFWKLSQTSENIWLLPETDDIKIAEKVVNYFHNQKLEVSLDDILTSKFSVAENERARLQCAIDEGCKVKLGDLSHPSIAAFSDFVAKSIPRKLKDHQLKAAIHLLLTENAANFSVPGAGKTTVVLSVFAWLRHQGIVDSLFVVGPPACFRPWRDEFEAVLGESPSFEILAGGNLEERHLKYYPPDKDLADLYLTTFQTLQRDTDKARFLLHRKDKRFFLVVDEAHYIKQQGGAWAHSVLDISPLAERRCVLTGTPFPHSYVDAINIFDTLYPTMSPFKDADKIKLINLVKQKNSGEAVELLETKISPLFYRVRKSDLHLADQNFINSQQIEMGNLEKFLYDTILDRILVQSKEDFFRDLNTTQNLQRGRMIRMRQAVSYAGLLSSAIDDYEECLIKPGESLVSKIVNYSELESPGKIKALLKLVRELRESDQKVVVWSNFIGTLDFIKRSVEELDWPAEIICGNTPTEGKYNNEVLSRETIIEQFKSADSGLDILIANPAACAESISLHRTCSHAIYYDLSYNCAQYLQSLDRIHRVGGSEDKISYYYHLQYKDTFESDILDNLMKKSAAMSAIIDREFPVYEMDLGDGDVDAYSRIFK